MKSKHGSDLVTGGGLKGATDRTDYFYFFCPRCPDSQIVRLLDFEIIREESGSKFNDQCRSKARRTFGLGFEFYCEHCGLRDYVKVSNYGWQGGKHAATLRESPEDAKG